MAALANPSNRLHIVLRCTLCGPLGLLFWNQGYTFLFRLLTCIEFHNSAQTCFTRQDLLFGEDRFSLVTRQIEVLLILVSFSHIKPLWDLYCPTLVPLRGWESGQNEQLCERTFGTCFLSNFNEIRGEGFEYKLNS